MIWSGSWWIRRGACKDVCVISHAVVQKGGRTSARHDKPVTTQKPSLNRTVQEGKAVETWQLGWVTVSFPNAYALAILGKSTGGLRMILHVGYTDTLLK